MNSVMLAQMWDDGDHMGNGWWWAMGVGWLLVLAVVVVLVVVLVRHFSPPDPSRRTAENVLSDRFARGEIDEEEYRRRREALRE